MPSEDDGSRDDPLLSDRSWAVSSYRPDVDALAAAPTRVVIAVGEESLGTFTGRTAVATAELLGQEATVFPSHHGGFLGGEFGYAGNRRPSRADCATCWTTATDHASRWTRTGPAHNAPLTAAVHNCLCATPSLGARRAVRCGRRPGRLRLRRLS
jgi:hypothetical protein